MNKETIINLISFIFALVAFGLYYFYFAITEYGPKSLPAAFNVSLYENNSRALASRFSGKFQAVLNSA